MSGQSRTRQATRSRRVLKQMTIPAAVAYVLVTVLSLVFRVVAVAAGLIAEISERIADAGETARAAVRGPVLVTSDGWGAPRTAGGAQ